MPGSKLTSVAIANHKGGTGKSTLAVHCVTWLARRNKSVVLVDLDTQGSVAQFLGLEPANDVSEAVRATLRRHPVARSEYKSFLATVAGYENLAVVRGWGDSAELEQEMRRSGLPPDEILREVLGALANGPSRIVVLDTGPYAGVLQQAALSVADHVVVPGIPEAASEAGVLDIAKTLRRLGRGITAVIPTMVVARASEHRATIQDWKGALGSIVYYDPREELYGLPRRVVWGMLVRRGRPIWDVAPCGQAAHEMEKVLRRIAYDTGIM